MAARVPRAPGRSGPWSVMKMARPVAPFALAFVWSLLMALASLAPALSRGGHLGDFELLSVFGWGDRSGVPLHNLVSADQVQEMVPWTELNWLQVHAGHLPLWNPFAGLGLPLAFNFQAASFSLPMDVAYLFPLHLAYTVTVVTKLVIAGTGATFLGRTLGLRLLPAVFGGTVFELSGAVTALSGWPQVGVFCWLGWILGAVVLAARSGRARHASLLAVFVAMSALGGHPESIIIELCAAAVFAATLLAATRGGRRRWQTAATLAGGVLAGLSLAAPLLLPGLQVVMRSSHTTSTGYAALPHSNVVNLLTATFYGLPVLHHAYFDSRVYYAAACYVGVGALVPAALAVVAWRRRADVAALAVTAAISFLLLFSASAAWVMSRLPLTRLVLWDRAVMPLELCLAVLAACGLHILSGDADGQATAPSRLFAALSGAAALSVGALWLYSLIWPLGDPGHGLQNHERRLSLIVPAAQAAIGLAAVGLRRWSRAAPAPAQGRRRREAWRQLAAPVSIAAAEVVFLLTAAPSLWSSSPQGFVATPAEIRAQQVIGSARIGFQTCPSLVQQPSLGVLAEANSAYDLNELAAYDPVVPKSWYRAWAAALRRPVQTGINNFCPAITTASLARRFGVAYIVGPPGSAAPAGTVPVAPIGGESVFHVPGAGVVTAAAEGTGPDAPGSAVPATWVGATMSMTVDSPVAAALRIHVSDLPGWSASVDGHPARLRTWATTMMTLDVPPGRHRVILRYRPEAFAAGLWVSLTTILVLAVVLLAGGRSRSRGTRSGL